MPRIVGVDIPKQKPVEVALTAIQFPFAELVPGSQGHGLAYDILVYDVSDTVVSRGDGTHHQYEYGHEDAGVDRRQHEECVLL